MKRIVYIIMLAVMGVVATTADAQVSVRRTPKNESSEKTAAGKGTAAPRTNTSKPATNAPKPAANAPKPAANAPKPNENPSKPGAKTSAAAPTVAQPSKSPTAKNASSVVGRAKNAKAGEKSPLASGKSLREQAFDDYQRNEATHVPWQHVVYRELDLKNGSNASLYYPEEPVDGMTNLFRVIIDLLSAGQIKGYEYLDGREVFSEKFEIKVKDVFDKFQIAYVEKPVSGRGGAPVLTVDETDVPSNEVLSYYVKERWEFDYQTSHYGPHILAICPVLHRSGDFGGDAVKYPMMWLNYEDLRPFLRQHLVMSEGMNNAARFTMEDFFALNQYRGDIYKVQNLRGLSLMQQYPNPDSLRMARDRIERELRGFSDSIWVAVEEEADSDAPRKAHRARRGEAFAAADSTQAIRVVPVESRSKRNRRTKEAVDMDAVEAARDSKAAQEDANIRQTGAARSVRRSR